MKAVGRWGAMWGALGGLIWAAFFFMEATNPGFDLRYQLLEQPAMGASLAFAVMLQAAGFHSLSMVSVELYALRISAAVCAAGAVVQSLAILAVSIAGLGAAWLFGILGELVITLALGAFAISSLVTGLPILVKLISLLMIPFYFIGWAVDPQSISAAGLDLVNLAAAIYGLLWVPLGYTVWRHLREQSADKKAGIGAA